MQYKKFLDTYESWSKVFKLCRTEDSFRMYIHDNTPSGDMIFFDISKEELIDLSDFIRQMVDQE